MVIGVYKTIDVTNLRGGYQEPYLVTRQIPNHIEGHYVRPNKIALKYLDFKKDVDPDVHVRMFNSTINARAETSKMYIINAFRYTSKDTTSDWCHNYMLEFSNYIFAKLT